MYPVCASLLITSSFSVFIWDLPLVFDLLGDVFNRGRGGIGFGRSWLGGQIDRGPGTGPGTAANGFFLVLATPPFYLLWTAG